MLSIFEFLDYDTFLSIWYWALVIISWSLTCHYTLGVPFDVVVRADRMGGQYAQDCDQLALIHARRIDTVLRRGGPFIAGFSAFVLVSLATLGFWFGYDIATALFMIGAPIGLAGILGARLSLRVLVGMISGEQLRRMIAKRRFWDQVIGVCAIFITALISAWHALSAELQAKNGTGLYEVFQSLLADWF